MLSSSSEAPACPYRDTMAVTFPTRDWQPSPRLCPVADDAARTPHAVAMVRSAVAVLSVGATLFLATPAAACPNCAVGRQAKLEVWNDDLARNLFVAFLPFLVIGAICVRVECIGRRQSKAAPHAEHESCLESGSEPLTLRRSRS